MISNHLTLCCPLLVLPSVFPSIRIFSNESILCINWPKSASVLPMQTSSNDTRDDSTCGNHQTVSTNIRLIIFISAKSEEAMYIPLAKAKPGADCVSDHELLFATFRLLLKKVVKTTRPFKCDVNQIPYDYMVGVMSELKGLDLVHRVPEELWMEVTLYKRWWPNPSQSKRR